MPRRIVKTSGSQDEYRFGKHRFEHWHVDNQVYFITARCHGRFPAFAGEQTKTIFWDRFDHYTKAQYVLPHQNKGPMLFYNIGLCYFRWHKVDMAKEFLRLALIKEPGYKKASKLLGMVEEQVNGAA